MDFTGILLAGGKSTRFGINKIQIEYEGIPLLADQIIKLGFFCNEVLVSSSDENSHYITQIIDNIEDYRVVLLDPGSIKAKEAPLYDNDESSGQFGFSWKEPFIRIVLDDDETRPGGKRIGPLAGIYSGLKESGNKNCLVLASDMPLVSYMVLKLLTKTSEDTKKDAVIIKNPKGIEALCAVYSRMYAGSMIDNIRDGTYKISEVLDSHEVEWIYSQRLETEKIDEYNFFNINTREDIKKYDNIRKNGIPGVDPDRLCDVPHNTWKTFFYRGMDRRDIIQRKILNSSK